MWRVYRRRHLWLFSLYRLFAFIYGSFRENGDALAEPPTHGRRLLSAANSTSPSEGDVGWRADCIPSSVEEFPDDFFTQQQRERGGLIVHLLVVAYLCAMLAVVCEKYFVPCLRAISTYFQVPEDIAGATFMAVGTSSPELFSSVIGAFVTEGDIGVGTVVGSAVFNLLAVTGAAGIAVGSSAIQLDWYPITRDVTMYLITISTLVFIIHDNLVTWIEALVLICMFVGYLNLLYFNYLVQDVTTKTAKNVHNWWKKKKTSRLHILPKTTFDEKTALIVAGRLTHRYESNDSACPSTDSESLDASTEMTDSEKSSAPPLLVPQLIKEEYVLIKDEDEDSDSLDEVSSELEESQEVRLWSLPESAFQKLVFAVMWPANVLLALTIPRCHLAGRFRLFPLTFCLSIAWLGTLSYLCFWMVAVVGYTLGIPDTVSGLTILAAGTSVPEMVSSVIVVKNGLGNMAFCNLLGSNIFDILFCLGVPWLAKTLMNSETRTLVINSSALTYTILILLSVVVLFYVALLICGWKLNWRYGIVAFILYAGFLVIASLCESNVFGDFNPPTCVS